MKKVIYTENDEKGAKLEEGERNRREIMHDISSGERQRRADEGHMIRPKRKKKIRYDKPNLYMR